jgi:hypothetical protein
LRYTLEKGLLESLSKNAKRDPLGKFTLFTFSNWRALKMANEIKYSGIGDIRLAAILEQELRLKLADRASLRGHPSVVYLGDKSGAPSTVDKIGIVGLGGYDLMSLTAEAVDVANTALTTANVSLEIGRYAKAYSFTDLAKVTDQFGMLDPFMLAEDAVASADMTFQNVLANVTDNFGNTAGTAGVALSLDDIYDAIFVLEQTSCPGPYICMLHPKQYSDLQNSLRAEAGAVQFMAATADTLQLKGPGFKGEFLGIEFFVSSKVPSSGGDRKGALWGRGAVAYADASVMAPIGAGLAVSAGPVMLEFERNAAGALTKAVSNYYFGVTIVEHNRGVTIGTLA